MRFALCITMVAVSALADVLPNLYDWNPGVTVGVPGGIPARSTIYTNLTGVAKDGTEDISAIIDALFNSCPEDQTIYIPAGTYLMTARVYKPFRSNVTIRGAGMGQTVLMYAGGDSAFAFGAGDWPTQRPDPNIAITAGAEAGSTNLTCDTTGLVVGRLVRVGQTNAAYVWANSAIGQSDVWPQTTIHKITATNATTVTIWPPLPLTLTNNPAFAQFVYTIGGMGVEDLTVNLTNSAANARAIDFSQAQGCWVKGVEVAHAQGRQMKFLVSLNCEVRDCYVHGMRGGGSNTEGLDFYGDCCFGLIENNLFDNGGGPPIILGDFQGGCSGNVVAFNEVRNGVGWTISVNHGPHNMFNLFEGNIAQAFQSDGYYGSASHNTLYRNYFHGSFAAGPIVGMNFVACVDLCRFSYYFNVVGNVLATNGVSYGGMPFEYDTDAQDYTNSVFRFGYPWAGQHSYNATNPPTADTGTLDEHVLDANVRSNTVLIANFDYVHNDVVNPTNTALPNSLFRTEAPSWWGTNRWPAIDPTNNVKVAAIPAQSITATAGTPEAPEAPAAAGGTATAVKAYVGTIRRP